MNASDAPASSAHPLGHFTWRSLLGLAGVVAAGTAFALLAVLVRVQWTPLDRLDGDVATSINREVADHPVIVAVLRAVTTFGGRSVVFWSITVGAAAAFLLVRRQLQLAVYLLIAGFGALALDPLLKVLVGRLRPIVAVPIDTAPGNSFPSGHALNATACYGALLLVFLPTVSRRLRAPLVAAVVVLVAAVGFSRVALGVHYLSDVVGGWLLGIAWLSVTTYAFRVWRRETGQPVAPLGEGLAPEAAADLKAAYVLPVRHPWMTAAWLIISWVLIGEVLAGVGQYLVRQQPAFDEAIPRWFAGHRNAALDQVSAVASDAGGTQWIIAIGLVIAPLAFAYIRRWRPVVFLAATLVGELTLFLAISASVSRLRPDVVRLENAFPTSSFPSGHTAATTALYGALAVLVVPRLRPPWRWFVLSVALLMPVLIGLSRIYRGAHHPLDVSAGALLALVWIGVVALAVRPNYDMPSARFRRLPVDANAARTSAAPARTSEGPQPSAVVANPTKMTHPEAERIQVSAALTAAGWPEPEWLETTPADPGGGQTRQAVDNGVKVVFAAGGDGTVRACAGALIGTDVALAVLPLGTGNLLAGNLRLPTHVPDAVAIATGYSLRRVDVGIVEDRCFTVMAGMGLDAEMIHDAPDRLKARLGWPAYVVAAVRHLCQPPMRVQIRVDEAQPVTRDARAVLIGNVGKLQGGMRVIPQAQPDDGVLDVAVLKPPTRRSWFPLAWSLLRRRPTTPNLETLRGKHIEIVSDREQRRELDGDLIEPARWLTAEVRPAALWLCALNDGSTTPKYSSRAG
jgi:undecaprenyl-diphosphatase